MQITIVQTEIESAIIAHIKSQVAIRDDQEITVDLRATRGAQGYQAVIDIRPKEDGQAASSDNDGPTPPAPTLKPQPAPTKPLGIEKAVTDSKVETPVKDLPKAAAVEPETKPVVEAKPVPMIATKAAEVAAEAKAEVGEVTGTGRTPLFRPKPAAAAATEEADAEPKTAPVSIFGSLKKPVNA